MKFKDNIFYKVVDDLKEKTNNFKAKKIKKSKKFFALFFVPYFCLQI